MTERVSLARRVWQHKDFLGRVIWLLALPFSIAYATGVRTRNRLYSAGLLPTKRLPRAVVSVGNLTVGGTGKTPTALWLAQQLIGKGYRVAILTRGYGRAGRGLLLLTQKSCCERVGLQGASAAGDEAWMMAKLFGQTLGVSRDRYEAGMTLLRDEGIDVFILDDGFQHRQLQRDIDLLLLGEDWGGWLLPAGPFREPVSALNRAHLLLASGAKEKWMRILNRNGKEAELFLGSLQPRCLRSWEGDRWREYPLSLLTGAKILAISGIASPASFYSMINDWQGDVVEVLEFEDHHGYSQSDWQRINRGARNAEMIVTTEKDMVKLMRFPFARGKMFALRVEMTVERGDVLVEAIDRMIREKLNQLRQ
jgi:tetraacyldisaccharide 4'-kinase